MLIRISLSIISILFFSNSVFAYALPLKPHSFFVGPEIYHIKREKEGGSEQKGWMYGITGTYERWPCKGFYWAADGYWATGDIKGHSGSGRRLKSELTESQIEGRLGYALHFNFCPSLFLAGYGAYGHFKSENNFKKPSPIRYTTKDSFDYGAAGIMAWLKLRERWDAGVHFKAMFMNEGRCGVHDDPDHENLKLVIGNENQYELYLPVRYAFCWKGFNTAALFEPFFRYHHFGFQENYPFDYFDTKFHIYGARFMLQLTF